MSDGGNILVPRVGVVTAYDPEHEAALGRSAGTSARADVLRRLVRISAVYPLWAGQSLGYSVANPGRLTNDISDFMVTADKTIEAVICPFTGATISHAETIPGGDPIVVGAVMADGDSVGATGDLVGWMHFPVCGQAVAFDEAMTVPDSMTEDGGIVRWR